jgi:DNA mismatch repair protein MutH
MVSDTPIRKGVAWAASETNKKLKKSAILTIQILDEQRIPKKGRSIVTSGNYQEETQKATSSGH